MLSSTPTSQCGSTAVCKDAKAVIPRSENVGIALVGGSRVPAPRLCVVDLAAKPASEHQSEGRLRRGVTLLGSKAKPGIFDSSTAKPAAQLCIDRGWLAATGEFEGKGKSRKELYRITPSGISIALENSEPVKLLTAATESLEQSGKELGALGAKIDALRIQAEILRGYEGSGVEEAGEECEQQ